MNNRWFLISLAIVVAAYLLIAGVAEFLFPQGEYYPVSEYLGDDEYWVLTGPSPTSNPAWVRFLQDYKMVIPGSAIVMLVAYWVVTRFNMLPKSVLGWWSVGLGIVFFLLQVALPAFAASVRGNPVSNPSPPSPVINMVVVADYISGIVSFVIGLISIIWSKERSILVFLWVAVAFFILIFLLGELIGW